METLIILLPVAVVCLIQRAQLRQLKRQTANLNAALARLQLGIESAGTNPENN